MKRALLSIQNFFEPPDPALIQAGAGGERLVAWTRLAFWFAIGMAPVGGLVSRGWQAPPEILISAAGAGTAMVFALIVLWRLRERPAGTAIGFVTGTVDLTIILLTLFAIAMAGRAEIVLHSQAGWAVILLVIMTSCLRFDTRLCLYMGLLAVVEYAVLLVLLVNWFETHFTTYDAIIQTARVVLMLAASALAMGVVNRTRSLMRASGFDPLTGLATRAYFNQRLMRAMDQARGQGQALSLVLMDLDHFKDFNDTHGHHAGDEALKHVAALIRAAQREEDFVARWGGEELAMIVPGLDARAAGRLAERIAASIRSTPVRIGSQAVAVTISAGVSEYGVDGRAATDLFAAADRRVFEAKDAGRDRVVVE
ncbi:GGDEF domain-containing protein [Wenzhouxiangella marina]|uniref:diguanylate cyclase n=1 Tax=Wenzhouxiangella marina TaxID=1579979 RepID=A0A0K0XZB0_9GAMM|nr:GGDEF domain-containing protein [Wenzhouxiangella marina]AKS43010.1 diguanylate cyclase [Wenzhouxiangella marina]MBB6087307.1 diguanylate cyclase (GGDEF)-like protein [Wenzhouxiangella marina]